MCIMTRHDSNYSPRLPKWTAWFRRRSSAGCLGFLRRSQGWETSVMLKWSWLFLDDHLQQRAHTSGSDVLLDFFSKLQSEIWRITNKEGKEAREHADRARARQRRFLAWIIAVVMLAAYSWNPVPGLHGLFTGLEGLKSMAFLSL